MSSNSADKNRQLHGNKSEKTSHLEGFSFKFTIGAETEFARDTETRAQGKDPCNISFENGVYVVAREETVTFYNERGRKMGTLVSPYDQYLDAADQDEITEIVLRFEEYGKDIKRGIDRGWPSSHSIQLYLTLRDTIPPKFKSVLGPIVTNNEVPNIGVNISAQEVLSRIQYINYRVLPFKNMPQEKIPGYLSIISNTKMRQIARTLGQEETLRDCFYCDVPAHRMSFAYRSGHSPAVYCMNWGSSRPTEIETRKLDLENPPSPITGVGVDDGLNFLFVGSGNSIVLYDFHSDPLKRIKELRDPQVTFRGLIRGMPNGNILVGGKNGVLRKIYTDLNSIPSYAQRQTDLRALTSIGRIPIVNSTGSGGQTATTQQVEDVSKNVLPEASIMAQKLVRAFSIVF
ncbi:MAG: hypothetical protein WC269_01205, partial [Candidatus Gracilibacteria bacterium]